MKRYKVTHIMNKKQLILILVAGLFCVTANAVVDLNATTPATTGTVMLASENEIDSKDGTDVSGTAYNATGKFGFIIPQGATYYVRIDLGGSATFMADPTLYFYPIADRASGGEGRDYVILSLQGSGEGIADDALWTLGNVPYLLKGRDDVDISYKLYENPSDAIAGGEDGALYSDSAAFIRFADATSMAGGPSASSLIDVELSSKKYENGTSTTHIMTVNIKNAAGTQNALGGSGTDVMLEDVVDKITLTATGDFTAVQAITNADDEVVTAAGKVWLDRDASCTPSHAAVEADADATPPVLEMAARNDNLGLAEINTAGLEAVVTLTNTDDDDANTDTDVFRDIANAFLCMQTNGASEIPEGSYSGELSMTAADDFVAIADAEFNGSTLAKNSETADLDFLLTPDGVYRNYVRLTNTSHVQGSNLRVTLINDAGDSVSFDLSDVVDEMGNSVSSDLAAGASTKLININSLYEAAQAVDRGEDADEEPIAMFTVTGEGMGDKLRAEFEGSVLAGHLKAQALSVSTDNTSFFTF